MTNKFGILPSGDVAHLYTISSGDYEARFTDLGATWVAFLAPDRLGKREDVVLGYDSAQDYVKNDGCLGAVVGRSANRIGGAQFMLDGVKVQLEPNEGHNNLHSGPNYWYHRLWTVEQQGENTITFGLDTPDGDQGYSGGGHVSVTYTLDGGSLTVCYKGEFDRKTVFNPTQHVYLNLAGHSKSKAALEQQLMVGADHFTPVNHESIPVGTVAPVEGTALDFRTPRVIGHGLENDPLLAPQKGVDHNFVLNRPVLDAVAAKLCDLSSGRTVTVYTDCPGIQVYTANFLNHRGKDGVQYCPNSGVCLETQFFPNSVNVPQWCQSLVEPGKTVVRTTRFVFSVE